MRQCILEGRLGQLGSIFEGASPETRQDSTWTNFEAQHSEAAGLIYGAFLFLQATRRK